MEKDICYFKTENCESINLSGLCSTAIRRLPSILLLNILFLLTGLPIITIGASYAAMTKVLVKILYNQPADTARDYFSAFIKNFKESTVCFAIESAFLMIVGFGAFFYGMLAKQNPVFYPFFILSLVVIILALSSGIYLYPLIVTVRSKAAIDIKNAVILGICRIKHSALSILFKAAFLILSTLLFPYSLPVAAFVGIGFCALVSVFAAMPVINREIIKD